jgi:hypothetical protein
MIIFGTYMTSQRYQIGVNKVFYRYQNSVASDYCHFVQLMPVADEQVVAEEGTTDLALLGSHYCRQTAATPNHGDQSRCKVFRYDDQGRL